jgi:cobalt/nickel transport protein
MSNRTRTRNQAFVLTGLGVALLVAVFLSPFASSNPDGLDRVSQDQGFDTAASENPPSHQLPFYAVFEEYALRGVPESLATPLAGLIGTLVTFGLAWGAGKLLIKGSEPDDRIQQD